MTVKLVTLISLILVTKILYNLYNFSVTKYLYKKYIEYIKGSKSWFIKEHKQRIINLFQRAGIKDSYQPNVELAGYGMVSTGNVSVFQNLSVLRKDIVTIINGDFREAIGIYRQRMLEAINPFYLIESFFQLPRLVLEYLGIKPESVFIKLFQLLWWTIVAISTLIGIFFNREFIVWTNNL